MNKLYTKMQTKTIFILMVLSFIQSGIALAQKPVAPDYSNLNCWAASPHKADASDQVPLFLKDEHPRKCKTQD